MKKLLIILVVVCVVFAAAVGIINSRAAQTPELPQTPSETETPSAPEAVPSALPEATPEPISVQEIDYDKIYALHEPNEIVMTVGGENVLWSEYFSWFKTNCSSIENYMRTMAMYGAELHWDDSMSDEYTFAEYIPVSIENSVAQLVAMDKAAEERGYVKGDAFQTLLSNQMQNDAVTMCGENATVDDLYAALAETGMSSECYDRIAVANAVYGAAFYELYGEGLEKIDNADALKYLEDNNFVYASHILIMMIDPETGEELNDDAKAAKLALVEQIYAELSEIKDPEALIARFKEIKELYCEDTGKDAYPDGYIFTPGTMVPEFEEACNALEPYGVSEPVESEFGYHIIMRLPLDPEAMIGYNDDGSTYNAKVLFADNDYNSYISQVYSTLVVGYPNSFEDINVCDFIK